MRRYKLLFNIFFISSCWSILLSCGSVSICGIGRYGFVSSGRTSTQIYRTVRRGYDRHPHGQRLVPLKVRRRRYRRRLADPLSTIILKDAPYSLTSCLPERTVSICHGGITLCSSGQGTTSGLTLYPKGLRRRSVSMLFWVKFICLARRFIVVGHGGNVHRDVYSILFLRGVAVDMYPFLHECFFRLAGWNPIYVQSGPLRHFSLGLRSAGVAPLPPCSRKLLNETVKTFAVFPSWLHLLNGEDNCMLFVPLRTSDLHCSSFQVAKSARWCPPGLSRCCATHTGFSFKGCSFFFLVVLSRLSCLRCLLDVSCLFGLTLRPSAPVLCCHQDS